MVLLRESGGRHRVGAVRTSGADTDETAMRYSRSLVRRVEEIGMAILSHNAPKDSRFDGVSSLQDASMQSVMCARFRAEGRQSARSSSTRREQACSPRQT